MHPVLGLPFLHDRLHESRRWTEVGYHVREEGMLPRLDSDFFLKEKKRIPPCLLTALHYMFPRKGWPFHPYRPLQDASLIYDEKNFNRLRKTDKTLRKCSLVHKKSDSNKIFPQTQKWYGIIYSNIKSKRQKLQDRGCASFVDNSMQIPKPI